MTVVRLTNGNLFLHSPIKFDDRLANELRGWGRLVISCRPTNFTTRISGSGQRPFPKRLPGHRRVSAKGPARGVSISTLQETSTPGRPKNGAEKSTRRFFPVAISRSSFSSTRPSKTLILTDTIINIELDKVTEPWRTATKLTGMYHPYGQIFFGMRLPLLLNGGRRRRRSEKSTHGSRSDLLSHGRCFDAHADEIISGIFGAPPH